MGNQISTVATDMFERAKGFISSVARRVAGPVAQYVVEHPIKTTLHVANLLFLVTPLAVAGPLLQLFGWGAVGVRAGSIAAFIQSTLGGTIAAGGIFATLQSAAMGGYGVASIVAVARIAATADEIVMAVADVNCDNTGDSIEDDSEDTKGHPERSNL